MAQIINENTIRKMSLKQTNPDAISENRLKV